jgi:uncharacterized membrane protein
MDKLFDGLLIGAILAGFTAAALALYGRYKTLPPIFTGPNICRLEAGGCQVLFRTKNAALLGIPNSALGVLYYPLLGIGLLSRGPLGPWAFGILFGAATFALLMTLILARILIRNKLECRVCWTGHFCNGLIWLLLLARFG